MIQAAFWLGVAAGFRVTGAVSSTIGVPVYPGVGERECFVCTVIAALSGVRQLRSLRLPYM
jgi:hypothetical protein